MAVLFNAANGGVPGNALRGALAQGRVVEAQVGAFLFKQFPGAHRVGVGETAQGSAEQLFTAFITDALGQLAQPLRILVQTAEPLAGGGVGAALHVGQVAHQAGGALVEGEQQTLPDFLFADHALVPSGFEQRVATGRS